MAVLKFTLRFKEPEVWEGVVVNHWKSSTGVKLTKLVLATPQWVGDNGVSLSYAITPPHNVVVTARPSGRPTCRAPCQGLWRSLRVRPERRLTGTTGSAAQPGTAMSHKVKL